jgi:hypothetical protein
MRRVASGAFGLVVLLIGGCVESVNPPFLETDLVMEPTFVGEWASGGEHFRGTPTLPNPDPKASIKIIADGPTSYKIIEIGVDKPADRAWLFKLQDRLFLCRKIPEGGYETSRITISGDCVKIWSLNFKEVLKKDANATLHKIEESGNLILTGSTQQLRQFFIDHSDDSSVWLDKSFDYLHCRGLRVGPTGAVDRKQRTLDYWSEMRCVLQSTRLPAAGSGSEAAEVWSATGREIRFLSQSGVDQDALRYGIRVKDFCDSMATYTEKHKSPPEPFTTAVRISTGAPAFEHAAATPEREAVLAQWRRLEVDLEAGRRKLATSLQSSLQPIR